MARRVESKDPDQLAYRERASVHPLLGAVILAFGLMMLAIFVLSAWSEVGKERGVLLWIAGTVAGGFFLVVGALAVFGCTGVVIDRRQGVVTRWSGLFGPVLRKTSPLPLLDRVAISRTRDYTFGAWGVREQDIYPVRLEGARGEKIGIAKGEREQAKARQLGEEIAKFLGFRLVDGSLGTEVVREAAEVGTTLRERTPAAAARAPLPEPPKGLRCRSSIEGDTLVLDIPPRGLSGGAILWIHGLLWGGILRPLSLALERWQVRVSPRELRVTRRGFIRSRTTAIPADRLVDLEIVDEAVTSGPGGGPIFPWRAILARSDTESVFFGAGLSPEELEWIKAVIESVISA